MMMLLPFVLATSQAQPSFAKPGWSHFASPGVAVDHVAVMRLKRDWGQPGEDSATITRSGSWLREDVVEAGTRSISISDLGSARSYHYQRDDRGRYAGLSITGRAGAGRFAVERTGQADHLRGETCTVWLLTAAAGYTEKNCLTDDGILLWQSVVTSDGSEISSARAISITRRAVRPDEVQPPADLLLLDNWGRWVVGTIGRNDEVVLRAATSGDGNDSLIIRRLGGNVMTEERNARGRTRIFSRPDARIGIGETPDGVLDRLDVSRMNAAPPANERLPKPVRLSEKKVILGEACTMFDMAPGVMDFGQVECHTADGLVLERTTTGWGGQTRLTAVRITRGELGVGDVAPPQELLQPRE